MRLGFQGLEFAEIEAVDAHGGSWCDDLAQHLRYLVLFRVGNALRHCDVLNVRLASSDFDVLPEYNEDWGPVDWKDDGSTGVESGISHAAEILEVFGVVENENIDAVLVHQFSGIA